MTNKKNKNIITEELTKSEINSMISSKIASSLKSNEFKKAVKELSCDVVNEIFKLLWQRNNFWKSSAARA